MAKQKNDNHNKGQETSGWIIFTGTEWITSDGRSFNTRLKAEKHLQQIGEEASGNQDLTLSADNLEIND